MNTTQFVICHTEHEIDVTGPNAGAEMATRHLARFIAKAGHKVSVLGIIKGGDQFLDGVHFIDLGSSYNVRQGLERIAQSGPYHLITAGRAIPLFVAQFDTNCLTKTLITHDRAGNDTGIKPKVLCQNVDRVVCVSNAQRQVFLDAGADPQKTITIHNGVDLEIFSANPPENRNLRNLVFAGALIPDKGIQLL
ncbi:MAG: glycosyltransferase family 4 protein, partial [Bdellovibrionales bacterium]|nr:glycosyltransferase family 4 protein [Bdellovibrionales bacterium]